MISAMAVDICKNIKKTAYEMLGLPIRKKSQNNSFVNVCPEIRRMSIILKQNNIWDKQSDRSTIQQLAPMPNILDKRVYQGADIQSLSDRGAILKNEYVQKFIQGAKVSVPENSIPQPPVVRVQPAAI